VFVTQGVIEETEKANDALAHLAKPYSFCFVRESDGGFAAYVREFPGCYSQGESLEQAYYNLLDAAMNWLMAVIELGQEIPEPLESFHPKT
jgi:antitoxin HicB